MYEPTCFSESLRSELKPCEFKAPVKMDNECKKSVIIIMSRIIAGHDFQRCNEFKGVYGPINPIKYRESIFGLSPST